MMSRRHTLEALPFLRSCLVLTVLVGCGDSPAAIEPEPEPPLPRDALALGVEVTGQVTEGVWDTIFYRVPAGVTTALRIESSPAGLHAAMLDTTSMQWIGTHYSTVEIPSAVRVVAPSSDERVVMVRMTDNRQDNTSGSMSYRISLFRVETTPEGVDPTLVFATRVLSQLQAPADVDVFRLTAAPGDRFVVFMRVQAEAWLSVDLLAVNDSTPISTDNFQGVDARESGRPMPPLAATGNGAYDVRVRHLNSWSADLTVPYRLEVLKLPAPDPLPTLVLPHAEVEAALTPYGDEDDFIFTASQGDVFRLFAHADTAGRLAVELSNAPDMTMMLEWNADHGEYITPPFSVTGDTAFVRAFRDLSERVDELPYTLRLWQADPAPESIASQVPVSGWLTGESIDTLGDVDEFTFMLDQASTVSTIADPSAPGLAVSYLTPEGDFIDIGPGDIAMDHQTSIGLGQGEHRLRLTGNQGFTGNYGLRIFVTSHRPEDVPYMIEPGHVVVETANRPRDTDQFELAIARERVFITLQGLGLPGGGGVSVILDRYPPWGISSPSAADTASTGFRVDFPGAGEYSLIVHSGRMGPSWRDEGSYRLAVTAADTAVENAPASLAVGDTVTASLENAADVDRFTISGTPGSRARIEMEHAGGPYRRVELYDAVTQQWVNGSQGTFDAVSILDDVAIPASGQVTVDVIATCNMWNPDCLVGSNAYELRVIQQ